MLKYFLEMIDKQVILEVEYPEDDQSKRRIVFYQKNGLVLKNHQILSNLNPQTPSSHPFPFN